MTSTLSNAILLLGAVLTTCTACGPLAYRSRDPMGPGEHAHKVSPAGEAQNRTFNRSFEVFHPAYGAIAVKDIRTIPPERYGDYRAYVRNGHIHFIVHPGYFPFFDEWSVTPFATDYSRGLPSQNLLERVGDALTGYNVAYEVARQQERITRDFIEHQANTNSLIILVLPRDYREHLTYGYVPGYDEYARYVNEMTKGADNILLIESDSHQNGYVRETDLVQLKAFLDAVGGRTLLLGGGFIGKCLDNFAASLRKRYPYDAIWYVPELTVLSPADIIAERSEFLSFWGTLRRENVRKYLTSLPMNRTTREPLQWADLASGSARRYR